MELKFKFRKFYIYFKQHKVSNDFWSKPKKHESSFLANFQALKQTFYVICITIYMLYFYIHPLKN